MCSGTMQSNRAHQNHHYHSFCLCTTCVCFEPLRQKGGASGGNSKHIGGLPVVSPGTVFQWSVLGWCASGQSWDSVPVVSPGTVCQWSVLGQCASGQSRASMGKNPLTGPWTEASIGQASCEVVLWDGTQVIEMQILESDGCTHRCLNLSC